LFDPSTRLPLWFSKEDFATYASLYENLKKLYHLIFLFIMSLGVGIAVFGTFKIQCKSCRVLCERARMDLFYNFLPCDLNLCCII